jgi:hypothetical protein
MSRSTAAKMTGMASSVIMMTRNSTPMLMSCARGTGGPHWEAV